MFNRKRNPKVTKPTIKKFDTGRSGARARQVKRAESRRGHRQLNQIRHSQA